MVVKLCLVFMVFAFVGTEGSNHPGPRKGPPKRINRPFVLPQELLTCLVERNAMTEVLRLLALLRNELDLGGLDSRQTLVDLLQLIFAEAEILGQTISSDGIYTTGSTTGPTGTQSSGSTYSSGSVSSSGSSYSTSSGSSYSTSSGNTASSGSTYSSGTTESTTYGSTNSADKRLLQLEKDLDRVLFLEKLRKKLNKN